MAKFILLLLLCSAALFAVEVQEGKDGKVEFVYSAEENERVFQLLDEIDLLLEENGTLIQEAYSQGVAVRELSLRCDKMSQDLSSARLNLLYWVGGTAVVVTLTQVAIRLYIKYAI